MCTWLGAAYKFKLVSGNWALSQIINGFSSNSNFGSALVFSPDSTHLVIGAYGTNSGTGMCMMYASTVWCYHLDNDIYYFHYYYYDYSYHYQSDRYQYNTNSSWIAHCWHVVMYVCNVYNVYMTRCCLQIQVSEW